MIIHDWLLNSDSLDRAGTAHGTDLNVTYQSDSKRYGKSANIANTNSGIALPFMNIFQHTNFSLSFWAKGSAEGGGTERSIFVESNSATTTPYLHLHKLNEYLRYYIRISTGEVLIDYYNGDRYFDDTWKFFVVSDANGTIKGWVDGAESLTGSYVRASIGSNENSIGYSKRTAASKFFNGYIQHMRVYDEALNRDQAIAIRETYLSSFHPTW